jgi:hypothetical protein
MAIFLKYFSKKVAMITCPHEPEREKGPNDFKRNAKKESMKNIFSIIIVSFLLGCSANDSINKHNTFLILNNRDLANLDSLNAILFRNKDKINFDFEKMLNGHDFLQNKKSRQDFESSVSASNNTKIELFTTDLDVTDSIVTYQILMTSYKQVKIFHSLTFNANPAKNKIESEVAIVKTKQLTPYWQYSIINN